MGRIGQGGAGRQKAVVVGGGSGWPGCGRRGWRKRSGRGFASRGRRRGGWQRCVGRQRRWRGGVSVGRRRRGSGGCGRGRCGGGCRRWRQGHGGGRGRGGGGRGDCRRYGWHSSGRCSAGGLQGGPGWRRRRGRCLAGRTAGRQAAHGQQRQQHERTSTVPHLPDLALARPILQPWVNRGGKRHLRSKEARHIAPPGRSRCARWDVAPRRSAREAWKTACPGPAGFHSWDNLARSRGSAPGPPPARRNSRSGIHRSASTLLVSLAVRALT